MESPTKSNNLTNNKNLETAYLAGGCFWGMEDLIRKLSGVIQTDVGYMGGDLKNATYQQVKLGHTGHAETLKVVFDPEVLTYKSLLLYFFKIHNPTTEDQQGNDLGSQYRSAIFFLNEDQKNIAQDIISQVNMSGAWRLPVVTEITEATDFWLAEEYHQDYLEKHPDGYTCHFERNINF